MSVLPATTITTTIITFMYDYYILRLWSNIIMHILWHWMRVILNGKHQRFILVMSTWMIQHHIFYFCGKLRHSHLKLKSRTLIIIIRYYRILCVFKIILTSMLHNNSLGFSWYWSPNSKEIGKAPFVHILWERWEGLNMLILLFLKFEYVICYNIWNILLVWKIE